MTGVILLATTTLTVVVIVVIEGIFLLRIGDFHGFFFILGFVFSKRTARKSKIKASDASEI